MKKILLLVFVLAGCCLLPAAQNDKIILVPAGSTRSGSINAFNSALDIGGKVEDAVFMIGGSLQLSGEVRTDVICLGTKVAIRDGAVVGRDLIVIGGSLDKAPGCRIGGEFYYIRTREDLKKITRTLLPFLPESGGPTFFKTSKIFFWFILVMLTMLLLPAQVSQAADLLKKSPLRHAAAGLLAMLIFILLLLVFILLSLVLIGIPLLLVLIAIYFLVLIFGRTVVFYYIGGRMAGAVKFKGNPIFFMIPGIAVYALLKFTPWFGVPLMILMDLVAVGIAVGFFLKSRKKRG